MCLNYRGLGAMNSNENLIDRELLKRCYRYGSMLDRDRRPEEFEEVLKRTMERLSGYAEARHRSFKKGEGS